ncbi:MAG TPA: tautomerase family protein [Anaeromyxobacteraceae bacterium]|nr:tautomerase family protein [Anaeromyxobacteraceae bacterium]
MPHLQFDLNFAPSPEQKGRFAQAVLRGFAEIMDTGTDPIAMTLRTCPREDLLFGRSRDGRAVILNADVRYGRSTEQKRRVALKIMEEVERFFGLPRRNVYVVLTEHEGESFQLSDEVPTWRPGENPLED